MQKYNLNMIQYFIQNKQVSVINLLKICKSVLKAFEIIHDAGYVYNNLKFENIMISG